MVKVAFVAGGSGFIGRHAVLPLLDRGFVVHILDANEPAFSDPRVVFHKLDLRDERALESLFADHRPTHLLSFAWYTRHGEYLMARENFASLLLNLKMCELFANSGGTRVVMAGTCFEYDFSGGACIENVTRLASSTIYGSCKQAMYELLRSQAMLNSLSWAWGRVFFAFGENEQPRRFVPALILPLLRGESAPSSHGNQIRDFMSTADTGSAFAALLASEVQDAVNIASGRPVTLRQIGEIIEAQTGRPGYVRFGEMQAGKNEPPVIIAATDRLRNEVGWKPAKTLEERLGETINWWRQHV